MAYLPTMSANAGTEFSEAIDQLQQLLQSAVDFCRSRGETDNITALALKWDGQGSLRSSTEDWIEVWARLSGEAAPEEYDRKLGGIL